MAWTADQVLALAPDPASAQAGKGLATPRKWSSLGQTPITAWGLCQGSGKDPYKTCIDLSGPTFKCSCPSRKFPCKHGLGLLLMVADQAAAFTDKTVPPWVQEWLTSRSEKAAKKAAKAAPQEGLADGKPEPEDPAKLAQRAADQAKRSAQRQQRVAAGIDELELWLRDLIRQGFAGLQNQGYAVWTQMAARLVDAQAPGLRRMVLQLGGIPGSGPGWQERLLDRMGRVQLLIDGYRRLDTLPDATQADIRTAIGWAQEKEEVLAQPGIRDQWEMIAQRTGPDEIDERMRVQQTWLWGRDSRRPALVLQFSFMGQPFERLLAPATVIDAELAFYAGAAALRALVKPGQGDAKPLGRATGFPGWQPAFAACAAAVSANPWLGEYPVCVHDVQPRMRDSEVWITDQSGRAVPVPRGFERSWELLALSGGRPIDLAGEWDGRFFRPLTVFTENLWTVLPTTPARATHAQ